MKRITGKKILSATLAVLTVLCNATVTTLAAENETIKGSPETTYISSASFAQRENSFNEGWKFHLGDVSNAQSKDYQDNTWTDVSIPHDFSISQNFNSSLEAESGFLPGGTGWYRKSFTLSEQYGGKQFVLGFDGVYNNAYVYVNGTYVGENHYGYNNFAFDITDKLVCDGTTENVIAVKAVHEIPSSRWYSGSGIYRDVTLTVTDPIHVALDGTYITTPNLANGDATANVAVKVQNDSDQQTAVTVQTVILDANETQVSDTTESILSVAANTVAETTLSPVVSSPQLWSIENPVLYTARTTLSVDGKIVDTYDTSFGYRYFSFSANTGFSLNGKNVKIKGVCMHHDQGALGSAAYTDAMERQILILKDMGCNAIRTSHNIASKSFIELCNKYGMLVMEEAFDGWSCNKNGNTHDFGEYFLDTISRNNTILGSYSGETWYEFALKSMINRDKNAPAIVIWDIGNEIRNSATNYSVYTTYASNMIGYIQSIDKTRPITQGDNTQAGDSTILAIDKLLADNGGVVGFNYWAENTANIHRTYPNWPLIMTETVSMLTTRGAYSVYGEGRDEKKWACPVYTYGNNHYSYGISWGTTAYYDWSEVIQKDYVSGDFIWTGFDYIGEPNPWWSDGSGSVTSLGAAPNSSNFGVVDTAGFEKDVYYFYRSQWKQDDTTLHIVSAWDSDNMYTSNGKTPVWLYTNAPVVELYRNGNLIGTATRTVHTTSAGHKYYTYKTTSNNSVCTAVNDTTYGRNLYAAFNVTYAAGTISAVAKDENGNVISTTTGNATVSTPGTVSKLNAYADKTKLLADGSSLAYVTVDVLDAKDVLDTTATNLIRFSLEGDGEIVGVDNGNPATTDKFQQSSVLSSSTQAQIKAYAGKALVIVRSTKNAGNITLTASTDNLTSDTVSILTKEETLPEERNLVSYTMVRDYTVKLGTTPVLETTATGTTAQGDTLEGTITWENTAQNITEAGDYVIRGILRFPGEADISVSCTLHVIADVIAVQNIAALTEPGTVPSLPATVKGILPDGTFSGEFPVTWEAMAAESFTAGSIVTVNGMAAIMGDATFPVTCNVRVAEASAAESENITGKTFEITENVTVTSDNLGTIKDGEIAFDDDKTKRWTNYNNREESDSVTLTLKWNEVHTVSGVNLYFFVDNWCAALPKSVSFAYSTDGTHYASIPYGDVTPTSGFTKTEYIFDEPVVLSSLQITLVQQGGTSGSNCVGLTEAEVMTASQQLVPQTSALLSSIAANGTAIEGFAPEIYAYQINDNEAEISAEAAENAGITILPIWNQIIRILTVSEDGNAACTYTVTFNGETVCTHSNTEIRNAAEATCTGDGYTGDLYCTDCGTLLSEGTVIPKTGHSPHVTGVKAVNCTDEGYTGDTICIICKELLEKGSVVPAAGHTWNGGVVTKAPTTEEEGIRTYTCTVCRTARTESIPKLEKVLQKPSVSLSLQQGDNGKIKMTGCFQDYANADNYYTEVEHGFVYMTKTRLGTRSLSVLSPGRTKVTVRGINEDGTYSYSMTPSNKNVVYVIRAFIAYTDENGKTVYVYSSPISKSYNKIN